MADSATVTQPIPLPSTANLVNPVDGPYLTFPPFPKAPEGVTIMPFKDFKERGICIEPGDDDAEVDTLGIPTVPIKVQHKTDECKTKTKRKRVADTRKGKKSKSEQQRLWWEQWEDAEAVRFSTGFNPWVAFFFLVHSWWSHRSWALVYLISTKNKNTYSTIDMLLITKGL